MTRSQPHARHDPRPAPGRRSAVGIGLAVVALAAAACSSGGGNGASGATEAAKASDTSTTVATVLSKPELQAAMTGYARYVNQNVSELVSSTRLFCDAITAGNLSEAQVLYPQARIYYERIEPVAEIWDDLDTEIDGRWENPVTDPSQFMGFHRLEQLLWADDTLSGAPPLCAGLMTHIAQLQSLVSTAQYSPLEMASGATDLLNQAATSKISGEEERYSNTDLDDLQANVDGAMEVFALLKPQLQQVDPTLVTEIDQRDATLATVLATFQATPGYDQTGYVEYSQVPEAQRRQLAVALNGLAESLSEMSGQVA
jgi:iron uptake system component EfeO